MEPLIALSVERVRQQGSEGRLTVIGRVDIVVPTDGSEIGASLLS